MQTSSTLTWIQAHMPVILALSQQLAIEKPLIGSRIAVVFHLTDSVAQMVLTLKAAGAEIFFIPSKPETIMPSALNMLQQAGIQCKTPTVAEKKVILQEAIAFKPHLIIDNVDLFKLIHANQTTSSIMGSTVHSKSAYDLVEQHCHAGKTLLYPVIGIGGSKLKLELESTLGTGQSVINALINVTKLQLNGKKIAVVGYGNVGRGIARLAKAMGAQVMVVTRRAYTALKAVLFDGFEVMSLEQAARQCDILLTATGGENILSGQSFSWLKDGVFIGNVGRYQEINVSDLAELSNHSETIDANMTEYQLNNRVIYLMGGGKQFNLVAGTGNSDEIMDLSLALHVLSMVYLWQNNQSLSARIYAVPDSITEQVATTKLAMLQR